MQELAKTEDYQQLPEDAKEEIKSILRKKRELNKKGLRFQLKAMIADVRGTVKRVHNNVSKVLYKRDCHSHGIVA